MKLVQTLFFALLMPTVLVAQSGISYNTTDPIQISNESIRGRLDYFHKFKSKNLPARGVSVWLPPCYNEKPEKHYPVLYMQDGQSLFNSETTQFNSDWLADETADSLIRAGEIQPIIIVAINATLNRFREYTPGPVGGDYMHFIIHELKPVIDVRYRTLPDRKNTAIGGSSAGGLFAFACAWEHNEVFSKVISFSPSFKLLFFDYTKIVEKGEKKDLKICFYHGKKGVEADLQEGVEAMIKVLKKKSYTQGIDFIHLIGKDEAHFGPGWSKYFPDALIFLFDDKKP